MGEGAEEFQVSAATQYGTRRPLHFSRGKLTTAGIYTSSHFDRVILPYGNRRRYRKTLTFRLVSNAISNSLGEVFLF